MEQDMSKFIIKKYERDYVPFVIRSYGGLTKPRRVVPKAISAQGSEFFGAYTPKEIGNQLSIGFPFEAFKSLEEAENACKAYLVIHGESRGEIYFEDDIIVLKKKAG